MRVNAVQGCFGKVRRSNARYLVGEVRRVLILRWMHLDMRILIISYYFPPVVSPAAQRLESFARYLAEFGHDVIVLTHGEKNGKCRIENYTVVARSSSVINWFFSTFSRHRKEINGGQSQSSGQNSSFGFKLIKYFNSFRISRGLGFLGRMPDLSDFWAVQARKWLDHQEPVDWVISSYAPYSNHLLGLYCKKANITRHWLADFRDLWSDHHFFRGLPFFSHIERILEKKVLASSDIVTTVSAPFAQRLDQKMRAGTACVIHNGFSADAINLTIPKGKQSFDIVYTGTIYPKAQDITPFLMAIGQLNAEWRGAAQFSYYGPSLDVVLGTMRPDGDHSHIRAFGVSPHSTCVEAQLGANVLLFLDVKSPRCDGILPAKIFEYIGSGKPILAITDDVNSSAISLLLEHGNTIVASHDQEEILATLRELVKKQPKASEPLTESHPLSRRSQAIELNRLLENATQKLPMMSALHE